MAACVTATSLPSNLLGQVPVISATKNDGVSAATKVPEGTTITYTNVVSNTGAAAATGVTFSDPDVPNTTIVEGSVHISPLAINDSYQTLANTTLNVAEPGGPDIQIAFATTLAANDVTLNAPAGTDTRSIVSHTAPANGTITSFDNSDGSFAYSPNAGFVGTDTFTYTVQNNADTTLTDTATVTIEVVDTNPTVGGNQKIWYVKNNAPTLEPDNSTPIPSAGTSRHPFRTLVEAQTASGAGDIIYVFTGSGLPTGQSSGIVLKDSQRFLGEGVALSVPVSVNGGANPTALRPAGQKPAVTNTAGAAVAALNLNNIEIRGFNLLTSGAGTNAVDISTTGAGGGSAEVANNTIQGAVANGIDFNGGGSGTLNVSVHDNDVTANGNGIEIQRTAGTVIITAFDDNVISGNGGSGMLLSSVTFDAIPGGAYNQISAGNTAVGNAGNAMSGAGIIITNMSGDLGFNDLDIYAGTGAALSVTGGGVVNVGAGTGARLTVVSGSGTFISTGGAAVDITNATIDIQSALVTSTNSSGPGVSLTGTGTGTTASVFSAISGSSITNATGTDFVSAANDATVTYNGTITDDVGVLVAVTNNTGGTKLFTGAITDGNDGDGGGITLTNNTGATINFSGGLTLSTGSNNAFTATGGGTINVTQNNGSIVNTVITTSGQAVNIANTTIGASGVTFRKIDSGAGANNGITLDTTGSAGGFTVVGLDGADAGTDPDAGSGGTISGKTGADGNNGSGNGIFLRNTMNVVLNAMVISNHQNNGIRGMEVDGFRLAFSLVGGVNGTNVATPFNEGSLNFIGTATSGYGLRGAVAILDTEITGGFQRNLVIDNSTGTMNLNILRCNIHHTGAGQGDDGIYIEVDTTAVMFANISNNIFTAHGGDHFNLGLVNNANADLTFTNNDMQGGHANALGQGVFILGASYNGTFKYDISNNGTDADPFTGNRQGGAIHVNKGSGEATFSGRIVNNVIGNPAVAGSGSSEAFGIIVGARGTGGSHTTLINNNKIRQYFDRGIVLEAGEGGGDATPASLVATVTNNTISNFADATNSLHGIHCDFGIISTDNCQITLDVRNNLIANAGNEPQGGVDFRMRTASSNDVFIAGYSGGNSAANAQTYIDGQNPDGTTFAVSQASSGTYNNGPTIPLAAPNLPSLPPAALLYAPAESTPAEAPPILSPAVASFGSQPDAPAQPLASPAPAAATPAAALQQAQLDELVAAARQRWIATGLSTAQLEVLEETSFSVADLPGMHLGSAVGTAVQVDQDAGGNGWFVDATPADDAEFAAGKSAEVSSRVDLLTTIMHEMGHALGLQDTYNLRDRSSIMYGHLTKGERRSPAKDQARGINTFNDETARFLSAPITIGTLPAGKSVTIKYSVTVNPALTWNGATQLSSHGTVTGTNFTSVNGSTSTPNTDDPNSAPAKDATITLLDRPDATVLSLARQSSNPNKSSTVSWQIVFSAAVNNLTASNFALIQGGGGPVTGASITGVSATTALPATTWNITADSGTGDGTLGLNFTNDLGLSHEVPAGPYVGEVYTVDKTPPVANSFVRQNPSTQITNLDTLVFRVTFSENVAVVDASDFTVTGTTATVTGVSTVTADTVYDITVSGGDLASYNGVVGLNLNAGAAADFVRDAANNDLPKTEPATDQTYDLDNTAPTVVLASATADPAANGPIPVTVTFSESVTGFTAADITTANAAVNNFAGSGGTYTFDLVPTGPGVTATADIVAGVAQDAAGNTNTAATQFSRTIVDQVSVATLNAGDNDAAETGGNTGSYTFTRGNTSGTLVVDFQLDASSTATAGTDFTLGGATSFSTATGAGTVTFANGQATAVVTLTAVEEAAVGGGQAAEAAETAQLNVVPQAGSYLAGAPANATVTIAANGFVVVNTNDSGGGSLRQAVLNANDIAGDDAISFAGTVFTDATVPDVISLTSGHLLIASNISIAGAGADVLTVRNGAGAGSENRVFRIDSTFSATLRGMTIADGRAGFSAGIDVLGSGGQPTTLNLISCTVSGNTAGSSAGGIAGGPGSVVNVINSTISGNTANGSGGTSGGIDFGGSVLRVINSTISGNSTPNGNSNGGGIGVYFGSASIINSTITNNLAAGASSGGGILAFGDAIAGGSVTVGNSVIAGNQNNSTMPDVFKSAPATATLTSTGGNVIGNRGSVAGFTQTGDVAGTSAALVNPLLGALSLSNGGSTATHSLLAGSPALNTGVAGNLPVDTFDLDGDSNVAETLPVDQRGAGFTRSIGAPDAGAFELQKSISILADAASALEGSGGGNTAFTFTVSRTGETSGVVNFDYAVTGTGGNPANAADFGGTLPSGSSSFLTGASTATVTINVSKDALAELDEGFTVTISNPDSGFVVNGATASSIITNDDNLNVTLNQASSQADPTNASTVNFTVVFSEPVTGFATGDITLGGTAGATTGTVSEIAPNNGTTYNVAVTGMTGTGTVTATIAAAQATSAGGAASQASTSTDNSVLYDAVAPNTTITAAPPTPSSSADASFSFSGSDGTGSGVSRFEVQIDGGGFSTGASPHTYTGLADGSHTFQVRAVDAAGNVDPTPASFTWVVDTIAPNTTITGNPTALSSSANATFSFVGNDGTGSGVVAFEASIDGGGFTTSTSPQTYTGLADGQHTVQIRAVDAANNTDPTPASYTWTIDTTPPAAPVLVTPANGSSTSNPLPVVSGTAEPQATVTVIIDGSSQGNTTADSSGNWTFTPTVPLADGAHTVRSRAADPAGNISVNSNTNTFTVDTVAPDTTMTATPANPSNSSSPSFSFAGNDGSGSGVARFETSLDGAPFTTATSPASFTGLADGSHTFLVRAIDNVNNVDATPSSFTWTVDTQAPTVAMASTAANPAPNAAIPVTVTFSEGVTDFTSADIVAGSATVANFAGSGATYTFDLVPSSPGVIATADIAASAAQDAAGNGNTAATQLSRTIVDQVSITATDATAAETGGDTASYTFTRGGVTGDLVVDFQLDASSTAGTAEYALSGASVTFSTVTGAGTVTIPASQTSVVLTLTASADAAVAGGQAAEPAETVRLNVVPRANDYIAGAAADATVTITENGFVVVNADDAGNGSLRQAVANANTLPTNDVITFSTPQAVVLTHGDLLIQNNGTLAVQGGSVVSISGNNASRIFNVDAGAKLTLRGLTLTGGRSSAEGGAIVNAGMVTIIESTLTGNSVTGLTSSGGAIQNNSGAVGLINSTVSGNSAKAYGGAVFNSGGIVSVVNSTISGNSAGATGGGVHNDNGTLTVDSSTVTANTAVTDGGGVLSTGSALTLYNSILAGNTSTSGAPDLSSATVATAANNLIGVNTGHPVVNGTNGNQVGTTASPLDALLGPLANNGGPTQTHMLQDGSPAINAGDNANLPGDTFDLDGDNDTAEELSVDQRGIGFVRVIGTTVDLGAYEAFAFRPAITAATFDEDTLSTTGLVVTPNTADGGQTTAFKITNIQNGTLYKNDGTTVITAGTFLTLPEGAAGLKFRPAANLNSSNTTTFGFDAQATVDGADTGLRTGIASATITVTAVNDAPTVVSPGLADETLLVAQSRSVPLPAAFTDIDGDTLTFTVHTNSDSTKASAVINGTNVDIQGLAAGITNITIEASDGNLGTVTDTFQISVGTPDPTVGPVPPPPGPNGYLVSGQTGLFSITVPVTNTTPAPINGFRLTVDYSAYLGAYPSLRLYNSSSAPGVSPAFINYPYPVAMGATVNVRLDFYTSTRTLPNPFSPTLTATSLQVSDVSGPAGPGVQATIRVPTPGQVVLEWPTTPGQWYRVQYSDDMVDPNSWYSSPIPLQAAGNRMQWIDSGAPFTHSPPAGSRFYRVNQIPPPAP